MADEIEIWRNAVEALAGGSVAGADPGPFERHETHVSEVLVSPRVAYKFKKPMAFGVVDYSTLERRRDLCRTEVALNRRLAPDVYLGAAALVETPGGLQLAMNHDEAAGEVVEWVVVMRHVDQDLVLSRRVDLGRVTEANIKDVGRALAQFHLAAPRASRDGAGNREALKGWLDDCLGSILGTGDGVVEASRIDGFARFVRRWLAVNGDLLAKRAEEGCVREGHGDLRLEHVVVEDDAVAILDCVEFDSTLRESDVLADLAFLVMELELARRPDLVGALTGTWMAGGGPLDERLLWFFAACKAFVRAEVGARRASQLDDGYERLLVVDIARAHMSLAEKLAWRVRAPAIVVVAGLSGSGKTTASKMLAERWGVARFASDELRKQVVGVAQHDTAPDQAYATQVSEIVYERLGALAGQAQAAGQSVVIDATFRRQEDRARFGQALFQNATEGSRVITALLTTSSDHVLRNRVREREEREPSEAGLAVLDEQLDADGSLAAGMPGHLAQVNADASIEDVAAAIDRHVLGHVDVRKLPA